MLEQRLPAVTSVLAAGLAASCCILPIALIATGLASAGLTDGRRFWGILSPSFSLPASEREPPGPQREHQHRVDH